MIWLWLLFPLVLLGATWALARNTTRLRQEDAALRVVTGRLQAVGRAARATGRPDPDR